MNRKPTEETEEIKEEADYVNAAVCTVDKTAATSDQKFPSFTQSFTRMAACWLTLLVIMALRIYFTSVMSENIAKLTAENQNLEKQNQTLTAENQNLKKQNQTLTAENQNLKKQNQTLTAENQNLTAENQNLTAENQNLTAENQNLKKQNQTLTAENQNLTAENKNLTAENQNLETQRNNLTDKIQDIETKRNELRVSQAQRSIDAYCPKQNQVRQCQPCQNGSLHFQSGCYAIIDNDRDRRTWDEAREDCKIKISDLAVIVNEEEKAFIKQNSWGSSGTNGYWIGLRVEDGKWKWVDGSDLTETSWIPPPTEGHCAISVVNDGWKSVSCDNKNRWVCRQKDLSV